MNKNEQIWGPTLLAFSTASSTNWSGPQTPSGVPRADSAGGGFLYHILTPTSLVPNSVGSQRPLLSGGGFPYHISSLIRPTTDNIFILRGLLPIKIIIFYEGMKLFHHC